MDSNQNNPQLEGQPKPPATPVTNSSAPVVTDSQQRRVDINSIYPVPGAVSSGVNESVGNETVSAKSLHKSSRNAILETIIIVFGIWVAGSSVVSLSKDVLAMNLTSPFTVLTAISIVIGIGLVMRKNSARIGYIFISIITLFVLIATTFSYYGSVQQESTQDYSQRIENSENRIAKYKEDTSLPGEIRQQLITREQSNIDDDKKAQENLPLVQQQMINLVIFSSIPLLVINGFFLLPPVKRLFH